MVEASPAPEPGPSTAPAPTPAAAPRRRFVGKSGGAPKRAPPGSAPVVLPSQIDPSITNDPVLNAAIEALLPAAYNFEVHKTIHQIRKFNVTRVALQMPEGLLMFACSLVDLVERFGGEGVEAVVLGDVTYGACCVDDYTAIALGCDFLVHYGHSCLIPVDQTAIRTLYVFVEINIDRRHLAQTIRHNFPGCIPASDEPAEGDKGGPALAVADAVSSLTLHESSPTHLAVVGTVQFVAAVHSLKSDLESPAPPKVEPLAITQVDGGLGEPSSATSSATFKITVPQIKPLSPGEILGCTAPKLPADTDALLYVGDGRFHLESIMIANPSVPAFRYDPYEKRITREGYDHPGMRRLRGEAVEQARGTLVKKDQGITDVGSDELKGWAVVLGTLGRQGSLAVMKSVTSSLSRAGLPPPTPILLSELSPAKMSLFAEEASAFVQTSCPRLSIDWGYAFPRPLLSPYEAKVALGEAEGWKGMDRETVNGSVKRLEDYPMDFYADKSLGDWTPRHGRDIRKVGDEPGRPGPKRRTQAAPTALAPASVPVGA